MAEIALGTWISTALLGSYLFTFASDGGRPESGARATHLPPLLLFVHPVIGVVGIGIWIAYLSTEADALAWAGVASLVASGLGGGVMAALTERHRASDTARLAAVAARGDLDAATRTDLTVAEQRIPKPSIALHGLGAGLTFVLVLLVAILG